MREARVHGGALGAAIARYGGSCADWLDLSTGINPAPPPLPAIAPEAWARLPEREAQDRLAAAARRFFDAPGDAPLVTAPGTQSLISLWPHLFEPCEAAVVSPTYGEHAEALREAGHRVREIAVPEALPLGARLLVVVNPNNPDARRFSRETLLGLASEMHRRGGLLVADEAFADADPSESLAPQAGRDGLLVLRSFGKFFGLAGLRLGFALAPPGLAVRLRRRLGPWAVSGPALAVATALMEDGALVAAVRRDVARQNARLLAVLAQAGLAVEGTTPLFALVRHDHAGEIFEALARRRILTRPFAARADWLRFGNPAGEREAARLLDALRAAVL